MISRSRLTEVRILVYSGRMPVAVGCCTETYSLCVGTDDVALLLPRHRGVSGSVSCERDDARVDKPRAGLRA
jgi:hypothetical protein